jgi:hypothetical protein
MSLTNAFFIGSRIFPKTGIFCRYSLYILKTSHGGNDIAMAGGAPFSVLMSIKKTVARSARARSAAKNYWGLETLT